jgi:hypothetical protein
MSRDSYALTDKQFLLRLSVTAVQEYTLLPMVDYSEVDRVEIN